MNRALAAVALTAAVFVSPLHAGSNFGGSAALSWNRVAVVSDLTTVPSQSTPLYVLLTGTPDVRSLAVELKWTPNDLIGPCYYLMSEDSTAAPCGWASFPLEPPGVFDGDSTYTWGITFEGTSRSCVTYLVGGEHCEGKPASFCLISVRTLDSNGEIDDLAVVGNATILGGTQNGCPVVAQDIYPHVAMSGSQNTFTIQGRELSPGTEVALVDGGTAAMASTVTLAGDTTATATIAIPSSFSGAADVVVTTPTSSDTLAQRVFVADSSAGLAPVWRLGVTEVDYVARATVTINEFANPAYPTQFPIQGLPIKHRAVLPNPSAERTVPVFAIDIAPLTFDTNGRPSAAALEFAPGSLLATDSQTGKMAILAPPGQAKSARPLPARLAAHAVSAGVVLAATEEFLGWERSPNERWLVAHATSSTQVFVGATTPSLRLTGRSYGGAFSRDARRYAAVLTDERVRRWLVLSSDGTVLREGTLAEASLSQLELSAKGDVLTFAREQSARVPPVTVAVNLSTGEEHTLSAVPEGTRYYSADGNTMLVLRPYPGKLQLFDVSDPLDPVEIASPFEPPNGHFITGAVSNDGSLLAVQMLEEENNASRTLTRVIALDRNLQQRAVVATRQQAGGLQFEGRFLFVGTQRHPIPAYFILNPTTEITLYDLSGL